MAGKERDEMPGRLANREDLVTDGRARFYRRRRKTQRCESLMNGFEIINHEIEARVSPTDTVPAHQQQMCAAAHFVHRYLGAIEDRAHADGSHPARGLHHTVRVENDVRHSDRRTLIVFFLQVCLPSVTAAYSPA
jgi:hypothetical protein